jgi:tripartite-type tricarboxylate transporter receptor subunit TctC
MIPVRATLALLACLFALRAQADPAADFYKGATVTMVVSTSAGGGYDTLARAIARQLGQHIPGHPTIVVRNMPGAGGIIATNYLYSAAPRDGSVLGLIQSDPPLEPLFGAKQAQFDPLKFNWLGTPSVETAMVLVWHTVPVNSVDDLRRRVTEMGASGANSTPAFFARLLNAILGTKMRVIPAYPGQNDAFLAMERGELDGYPSVFYSALSSTRPTWLPEKKAKVIVQFGSEKLAALGDVPFAPDLVTPRRERPPMAQLDGREPQMAQIRWQRTESPHPYVCPLCQIRTFLVSDLDRPFCHPLSMVPIRVTPMASSSRNTAVEIPAGTRSTSCRIQMAPTASSAELAGALTWHPSECDRCVALQVSVSGGWRFTGMLLV